MSQLVLARAFAQLVHAKHTYADGPYTDHLDEVERILTEAGMGSEKDRIRAYLHDTIEDIDPELRKMAQDFIFTNFGFSTYSIVWALTGIGHNRKVRNANAYEKIARYPMAANYKVADRLANWGKALEEGKADKAAMYLKEADSFWENVVTLATNDKLVTAYYELRRKAREVAALAAEQ